MDDLELIRSYAARGDPQAIRVLVQRHHAKVLATTLRQLRCQADAEDATQDVFLSLMEDAGKIRSNVGAWLHRCAVNTATSMIRSRRSRTRHEVAKARLIYSAWRDGEAVLREHIAILHTCLGELDATDHKLLLQNCVVGTTQKEIASSLGVTQQAVAKRIGRALAQLRRGLSARGVVISVVAAVVLLAKRIASAAIPHGLRTTLTSLPSASLASGGAAGAGTACASKVGAATALVLLAAAVTYECSLDQRPAASPPETAVVSSTSAGRPSTGGKTVPAGSFISNAPSPVPISLTTGTSAQAPSGIQVSRSSASSGTPASDSSLLGRQVALASNVSAPWQPPPISQDLPARETPLLSTPAFMRTSLGNRPAQPASKTKAAKAANSGADGNVAVAPPLSDGIAAIIVDSGADGDAAVEPLPSETMSAEVSSPRADRRTTLLLARNSELGLKDRTGTRQWALPRSRQDSIVLDTVSARSEDWPASPGRQLLRAARRASAVNDDSAGDLHHEYGSQVEPIGKLMLDGLSSFSEVFSNSNLDVDDHEVTLRGRTIATKEPQAILNGGAIGAINETIVPAGTALAAADTFDGRLINQGLVAAEGADARLYLNGLVSGAGSFSGDVVFRGGFSPGNSPAAVRLDDAVFGPSNTLTMELGGLMPGSQHDQVIINHLLTLDGHLEVDLINGFVPRSGDRFVLFDGNLSGRFADLTLPTLSDGVAWSTGNLYTDGSLEVLPEPTVLVPQSYLLLQDVDSVDSAGCFLPADWAGAAPSVSLQTVPEPASFVLFAISATIVLSRRRAARMANSSRSRISPMAW